MLEDKELKKLQKLAKINFDNMEIESFSTKLGNIISMIDTLRELDCSDIEPLRSVCDMDQRLAIDEIKVADISDDLFKNIPEDGAHFAREVKYFVVPKVIE